MSERGEGENRERRSAAAVRVNPGRQSQSQLGTSMDDSRTTGHFAANPQFGQQRS